MKHTVTVFLVADLRIHARADIVGDLSGYIDFRQRVSYCLIWRDNSCSMNWLNNDVSC